MKKLLTAIVILLVGVIGLSGCSGSPLSDAGFEEAGDGTYTYLDTTASPLPEGGVKVDLETGQTGSVTFTVTDTDGNDTVDYYQFTPADKMMLRHRYVAGMGMTYNYYYNYGTSELEKVTDADDEDVTESMKMSGRWDSAATETAGLSASLISYFETTFGMTMSEAVEQ